MSAVSGLSGHTVPRVSSPTQTVRRRLPAVPAPPEPSRAVPGLTDSRAPLSRPARTGPVRARPVDARPPVSRPAGTGTPMARNPAARTPVSRTPRSPAPAVRAARAVPGQLVRAVSVATAYLSAVPSSAALRTVRTAAGSRLTQLRAAVRVADRRGLTAAGAVALVLLVAALGGSYDLSTGDALGSVFAGCFVLGCALAAGTVHREDLRAVVVMPPLVYAALVLLAGAIERPGPGSFLASQALELVNALVLGAPVLLTATTAALLLAAVRLRRRPATALQS